MSATPPPPPPPAAAPTSAGHHLHHQHHVRASFGAYRSTTGVTPRSLPPSQQQQQQQQLHGGGQARWAAGGSHSRGGASSSVHTDPVSSGGKAFPERIPTASRSAPEPATQNPSPTPVSRISAEVLESLTASIHESLAGYVYPDAIELAQRLFSLESSYAHLHLLAHCYALSGAAGTAYRLLQHHYPFLELHITRPRTAGAGPSATSHALGFLAGPSTTGESLPPAARRRWNVGGSGSAPPRAGPPTAASSLSASSASSAEPFDLSYEPVDLKAQWACQYLLGVCCYHTKHYEEGAKVLLQLLYVAHQLTATTETLRHRRSQLQQQQRLASEDTAGLVAEERAVETQLRACAFVTDSSTSQVLYWLGMCEKLRQRHSIAAEHLRRACVAYPTRVDAFHEYVRLAWPSECAVQTLLAVKEPLAGDDDDEEEEELAVAMRGAAESEVSASDDLPAQRPPLRRGRNFDAERKRAEANAARQVRCGAASDRKEAFPDTQPSCPHPESSARQLSASQRRCVQQDLRPYLHAAFLVITYRCPEAIEILKGLLLQATQQQQQQAPAGTSGRRMGLVRPSTSSSFSNLSQGRGAAGGESALLRTCASFVSPWLLRHLALAQFHNGDVADSAESFARLLREAPWELASPALVYYSTALWHLKSESALGSLSQQLTDAEPFSATTCCVVANAYSLIKDPRDALVMLKRAVQVAPTMAYAHALYGYELLGQDNKTEAEAAFKAALAVDPQLYIAFAGLGERFLREEQIEKARGYYLEAVKLNPTPAIMNRFALTYHRQGKSASDLRMALRLYTESLLRHPSNDTARRQRADVLLRMHRTKEAVEELKALLVRCPGDAVVYLTLAECMVSLRRPQEALQHYQTAMHLDPRRESYVQGCIDQLAAANML